LTIKDGGSSYFIPADLLGDFFEAEFLLGLGGE
jgi:hypothetical protein